MIVLAALLAAGLATRVLFLVQLERSGFADVLSLDSRFYNELARSVAAGGAFPAGPLSFNPLYPVFLIVMFKLFGAGLLAPRVVQVTVGLGTIALVFFATRAVDRGGTAGKKATEPRTSTSADLAPILAVAIAILYSRFVLYEGSLIATAFEVFFMTASFALALVLDRPAGRGTTLSLAGRRVSPRLVSLLLGVLLGAGALGRPNLFLLLAAAVPIWLFVRNRRVRGGLALAACCAAGSALVLLPPIAYNARESGRFVPVTAHGGVNFYIGNAAGSNGLYRPLDEMRANIQGTVEDARASAEAETGRHMTAAEVSDYYTRRALGDIRRDPAAWLRLLGRKLMLLANGKEIADMPNIYFYETSCGVLRLLIMPYGAIVSLGLCGLVLLFRSGRHRSVVSVFLGCAVVSVVLFFVNTRYRLPAVPILIILASLSLSWACRELSRGRLRGVAIMAAGAAVFYLLVPSRNIAPVNLSYQYAFLGNYYLERGDDAKAAEAFAEAYRMNPDRPEAIINYARILRKRGDLGESAAIYERAHERSPGFPGLAIEYGFVLQLEGRLDDAKRLYLEAASSNRVSERVTACKLLAQAAAMEGRKADALEWTRRALALAPGDAQAASMLTKIEGMPALPARR